MLRMRLGDDLPHGRGLRSVEVQVLLHPSDVLFRVAATGASMATSAASRTMLTMTSGRRRSILRRSHEGRAKGKRSDREKRSDAIAGVHGVTSLWGCGVSCGMRLDDGTLHCTPCVNLKQSPKR